MPSNSIARLIVPTALCCAAFAVPVAAFDDVPPVVALRPNPAARVARDLIEPSCQRILDIYRGARAGMFTTHEAGAVSSREMRRIGKSKALAAFVKDGSLTDTQRTRHVFRWILKRPPTTDELARALKHVAKSKDRKAAFHDVIWALVNTKEFLFRK